MERKPKPNGVFRKDTRTIADAKKSIRKGSAAVPARTWRGVFARDEDLLTREDVSRLIGAAIGLRDKAIVAVLHESAARLGEFLDLRIGSAEKVRHGWKIRLDNLSGTRLLIPAYSMEHLMSPSGVPSDG